jgi:hypothetical protein
MGVKYVSEFEFPASFGFSGSSGVQHVKGYARGGHVKESKPVHKADGGHWIQGAIKHPGALHKELGVKQGEKIPAKKLAAAAKKGGVEGRRARFAETLKGMHKAKGGAVHSDEAQDKALIRKMVKPADLKKARGGKVDKDCMGGRVGKAGGGFMKAPGKKRMAAIHAAERTRVKRPMASKMPMPPAMPAPPEPPMQPQMGTPMGGAPGTGMRKGGRAKR